MDAYRWLVAEKFIALPPEDGNEEIEHPALITSTLESDVTGFQKGQFDLAVELADGFDIEGCQPFQIAIRLS